MLSIYTLPAGLDFKARLERAADENSLDEQFFEAWFCLITALNNLRSGASDELAFGVVEYVSRIGYQATLDTESLLANKFAFNQEEGCIECVLINGAPSFKIFQSNFCSISYEPYRGQDRFLIDTGSPHHLVSITFEVREPKPVA